MAATAGTIGFIGLGNMGRHMARRLAEAGLPVVAFDVSDAALREAADCGMAVAASARDVADQASTILCSLPTPAVVSEVLLGEQGIARGSAASLVIDLSTVGPTVAAQMAEGLSPHGIALVDAPASGGTVGAAAGTLTIMLAGADDALDSAEPLLKHLARATLRVGSRPGQAQLAKLVNNMMFACNLVSGLEAMAFGVKGGLDPKTLLDVINASSGRSYVTEQRIGPTVLQRDDLVRFSTALLQKDMALGLASAESLGARMDVHALTGQFLKAAAADGFAQRDCAAVVEIIERWNGVSMEINANGDAT